MLSSRPPLSAGPRETPSMSRRPLLGVLFLLAPRPAAALLLRGGAAPATRRAAPPRPRRRVPRAASERAHPASSSPRFAGPPDVVDGSSSLAPENGAAPWLRALARSAVLFALGYGLGTASAPGWQRHAR